MPQITVEGPIVKDVSKKRQLVKDLTDAATKAYGLPAPAFVVLIKENAPENVGVGGELLADRYQAGGHERK
jgi:4-oxalocrotonate tautomerase